MAEPRPYGSWRSPITAEMVAGESIALMEVLPEGDELFWIEMRPVEGGRYVIVRRTPDGATTDITPAPFNARTRVHEYGGGSFLVAKGVVYFSNYPDQRLYRVAPGKAPEAFTPEGPYRYADGVADLRRGRILCVQEDHSRGDQEARNTLAAVSLASGAAQALVEGNDFYSSPRLSPDGSRLAWLTWNHPNMPWDGTELWVATLRPDGSLGRPRLVAGGVAESLFQPEWSPAGILHFISDRTGWWNLYRWREADGGVEPLAPMAAEFGRPQWGFRMSTYGFVAAETIVCAFTSRGVWQLAVLASGSSRAPEVIPLPYTEITRIRPVGGDAVVFFGGSPTQALSLVRLDLRTRRSEVIRSGRKVTVDAGYLSVPQAIEFPTEGGLTAHAWFYPPQNRDAAAPTGEHPPLIVESHGGPTSASPSVLAFWVQYWTSRGFAVVDVNYGGSTGYGRAYRERLRGQWGVVDVDDCVNAARYLVGRGLVDGKRLIITGGSAGGYTTLCALTFRDVFRAGSSYFGISDLETFHRDTHKFESRYDQSLIGPYPERADLYRARSPIHFTDRLRAPMILLQGLEDPIVPPNQAEMMVAALRAKGLPVAYLAFEGEQHGFRRAENISRALEAELYFFGRVFGFSPADTLEPIPIDNLP